MAKKTAKNPKDKIVEAALDLAAKRGWEKVAMADIAKKAGVSLSVLAGHFGDKTDILGHLGRMADKQAIEAAGDASDHTPVRERLFDILMERFDYLNQYRNGLVPVLKSMKSDPKQALFGLPHICRSMNWMLEAVNVDTTGAAGALRVAGLVGVYAVTLNAWKDDESEDMGKTMAALDKALAKAEKFAHLCQSII